MLINQINDDVDHLIGLCLLHIVLASESKLLGKEPGTEIIIVVTYVKVMVLDIHSIGHRLVQPVCSGRLTNDESVIIEDGDSSPGRQWLLSLPRFEVLPWCRKSLVFIPFHSTRLI